MIEENPTASPLLSENFACISGEILRTAIYYNRCSLRRNAYYFAVPILQENYLFVARLHNHVTNFNCVIPKLYLPAQMRQFLMFWPLTVSGLTIIHRQLIQEITLACSTPIRLWLIIVDSWHVSCGRIGQANIRNVLTGTVKVISLWLPLTAKRPRVERLGPFLFGLNRIAH